MCAMWKYLEDGLDGDERVIFPEMYTENRRMYDKICGIAYLVKDRDHPEGGVDWVWEKSMSRVMKRGRIEVLAKLLVVRLRMRVPWYPDDTETEFLVSKDELDEHREEYQVLDVYLRIAEKDNPDAPAIVDPLEFEINRDRYEVLETRYLVTWKANKEEEERLLNIDPGNWHSVMEK